MERHRIEAYNIWLKLIAKNLHPEALMNLGSPTSIISDLESGNLCLPKLGGSSESCIGIISSWKEL
jgi:hypothetical protein